MKRYLLFVMLCVCVSIGAWAETIDLGNSSYVEYAYVEGQSWNTYAKLYANSEDDFANWYYSGSNTGQLDNVLSVLRMKNESPVKAAKIPLKDQYSNSYIKLTAPGDWENPAIEIHIDESDTQSALSIWLNNSQNAALFSCANLNNLTITGKNPHWNHERDGNKGLVTLMIGTDGKPYFDIEVQNGSATGLYSSFVSTYSLFSSIPGRIYINDAKTSYIDLSGTSATVTSANDTDFATWAADNAATLSGITSYTFNGDAKFTTNGDNYLVINGNTATVTCSDNATSLQTWASSNSSYLSNVSTINFSSETTLYLTNPADETKKVVVSGNNVTVYCEDINDYNTWKSNLVNGKIINGKTVKTIGVKMKLSDECYIDFSEDGKTAYVHAKHAGCLTQLIDTYVAPYGNINTTSFPDGTTFVLGNDCVVNSADLTKLFSTSANNQTMYYIDLFDVTNNGKMTVAEIDPAISAAVTAMTTSWKSQYGIIVPYNSTIGTSSLIKSNGNTGNNGSTFTQYAAYYRDGTTSNLTLHVWDQAYWNGNGSFAAANYDKAVAQINKHEEIKEAETVTVSTIAETKFDLTKLSAKYVEVEITGDDMLHDIDNVTAPNTNIPERANIYVNSVVPSNFKKQIENTNIEQTPTNILQISGAVSNQDILSVNSFESGPRVLDLSNASVQGGLTVSLLSQIENTDIEYIILPPGLSKDVVCGADYSDLTNLKAVISSSNTDLVAYVAQAGSLAEARTLATGGSTGTIYPAVVGLKNVTLAGNLNAADIKANSSTHGVSADGHWKSSGDDRATGLSSEQTTITSLDLRDAVFANIDDMNFSYAGLDKLTSLQLPISGDMDRLPANCLENIETLQNLCIPSNYHKIGNAALHLCGARTIITDNDAHTAYIGKNGETFLTEAEAFAASTDTYTLSKNITKIETTAFQTRSNTLTDIYVLATTTPVCEKDAFSKGMYVGWEGFVGDVNFPYCRERYENNGIMFTVLHYPAYTGTGDIPATYTDMEKQYTDVTKIYTKKEQTGAIDGNGNDLTWPTFSELTRVFDQASNGETWFTRLTAYTSDNRNEVNKTDADYTSSISAETGESTSYTKKYDADNNKTYTFEDYIGWHQFVLTMATAFEPTVVPVNNQIVTEYEDAGWFTFCIPFDMTFGEVLQLMGVPRSEGNYVNKLNGEVVTEDQFPDIRQLRSVQRIQGDATHNNKVIFRLTTNLYRFGEPEYLTFNFENQPGKVISETSTVPGDGTHTGLDRRLLMGGHPYIIKAYKRKGETIPKQNLGMYVMNQYGNKFSADASCLNHSCYEQLGEGTSKTLRFAKPFENHKIQAASDASSTEGDWQTTGGWLTYDDNGTERPYYYTLVGQFWEQKLPKYCFYISKGKWYRNSSDNDYKWSPYKCVIMATPYVEDTHGWNEETGSKSGRYRNEETSHYPTVTKGDLLDSELEIRFLDGRDDDDFKSADAKYMFSFDDDIIEYDNGENEYTAIEGLDGEVFDTTPTNGKVYNMSGQYVGTSLEGLTKGLYIVNGKKYVVK